MGVLAGLGLAGFYLGIITLAQGAEHALQQAGTLWYWLTLLVGGFGVQAGLYSFIRHEMRRRAGTASLAASGGVSSGAMAACCAHHLSELLPLFGLAGLAAFLGAYQNYFMLAGVLANAVGITVMLKIIQYHRLCPLVSNWKVDMGRVRNGVLAASIIGLLAAIGIGRLLS